MNSPPAFTMVWPYTLDSANESHHLPTHPLAVQIKFPLILNLPVLVSKLVNFGSPTARVTGVGRFRPR